MRGTKLGHAPIILDEVQNTTASRMLIFLMRLWHGSRMIVVGDDSQLDLSPVRPSELIDALERLKNLRGIEIVRLRQVDIVRHPLVQQVVTHYGRRE